MPRDAKTLGLQVKALEAKVDQMRAAIVFSLTTLMDLRDIGTGTHATRLAEWAVMVGQQFGLDDKELRDLEVACLVHDLGKVGISDSILGKPGKLTREERREARRHAEYGWAILRMLPGFERVSLFVLHHHEHFDGGGYPAGLHSTRIPMGARILAVVDAFDAMVSSRPYRDGLGTDEAFRRLERDSGKQFDPEIVALFSAIAQESLAERGLSEDPQPILPSFAGPPSDE